MKTNLLSLAATLLLAASANTAFSADWIGNSAINVNGTWYYGNANFNDQNKAYISQENNNWWFIDKAFQSNNDDDINLGEISTLHIGGQCQTSGSINNWNGGNIDMMFYKIDNGTETAITLTYDGNNYGQYSNNNHYQSGGASFVGTSINISGFAAGSIHTLSVRFQCDDKQDPGNNNYYVARFKIKEPISVANADDFSKVTAGSDVMLNGLTLYKDGSWNTLCLPFSLTRGDVEMSDLVGAEIRKFVSATLNDEKTLNLTFSEPITVDNENTTLISAATPYIIKWTSGTTVANPVFTKVTIETSTPDSQGSGVASFIGCFSSTTIPETDCENTDYLYLGAGNQLYYPSTSATIRAFRAYFKLDIPESQAGQIKSFVLNFDDDNETTSIKQINNAASATDTYFTLDGRRLNDKPATAGLYIINGKKVVIK